MSKPIIGGAGIAATGNGAAADAAIADALNAVKNRDESPANE